MIFVSGTKRSGTSMWMQVLRAAGIPILGEAFPRSWDKTPLRDANPDGFYESILREGIYFATNPHPATGKYFLPSDVTGYAVKVFVPGVIRSERAFITHLVANLRPWREYDSSMQRLYALEDAGRRPAPEGSEPIEPFRFPPALEWWMENFALVRDITLRKLPHRFQTYADVLERPATVVAEVLEWIGHGDVDAAVAAVKPERRTQVDSLPDRADQSEQLDPQLAQVFDDLYEAIEHGRGLSGALLRTLNETNLALLPRLAELQRKVGSYHARLAARSRLPASPVVGLPK
jgi:hypothetical protein